MKPFVSLSAVFIMAMCALSCHEKNANVNSQLSLADYKDLDTVAYRLNAGEIRRYIRCLSEEDKDSMAPDRRIRKYYQGNFSFLWIDRKGIDARADSLLSALQDLAAIGLSEKKFRIHRIQSDLRRLKNLDFDASDNRMSRVAARLEYNLSKAYFRYVAGQRFGFMNPNYVFNHLDVYERKEQIVSYRTLYDIKTEHAGEAFYREAMGKIGPDSIAVYVRAAEPQGRLYARFVKMLQSPGMSPAERRRILVNMERCRWRVPDGPEQHGKYVLVNIPSFHLRAVDGDEVLTMRIAFGANDSKTPMLISAVSRMDVNPQWVMPKSIVRKSIMPQLGNSAYFARNRYFIRNRKTGKTEDPENVTADMLERGDYRVIQRGGDGNALGRIIFRFDNNLSIYLHDTSSRAVFSRSARDVSHGCVRVEKPFELSKFMLADKDEKLIDKISYSMNADVSPVSVKKEDMTEKMRLVADTLNRRRLVGSVSVKPAVPIFILYYTMYPDASGKMETFTDVYGYDARIYARLRNYIQ